MLELIRKLTPNCKKFFEHFGYMEQTFLVFEMLDGDLYDLIRDLIRSEGTGVLVVPTCCPMFKHCPLTACNRQTDVSYQLPVLTEVHLGLPFTSAIDVWGVCRILAFLYLAEHLFPVNCDDEIVCQRPQTKIHNQAGL